MYSQDLLDATMPFFYGLVFLALLLPALTAFIPRLFKKFSRKTRLISFNLALLVSLAIWVILVGEIYFRFYYDSSTSNGNELVSQTFAKNHYRFNKQLYRSDVEYPMKRGDDRTRISFIGDSYTEGAGLKELSDRFTDLIQARNPGWDIHNIARSGNTTQSEIDQLKQLYDDGYDTDIIVLVYVFNDLIDLIPSHVDASSYDMEPDNYITKNSFLFNFLATRRINRIINEMNAESPDSNFFNPDFQHRTPEMWPRQQERLKELIALIRDQGDDILVATIPYVGEGKSTLLTSTEDTLMSFCARNQVPCLNLGKLAAQSDLPEEGLTAFKYDYHPGAIMQPLFASGIESMLRNHISNKIGTIVE